MSNYNSRLQTNNTNLQDIIETINALPETDGEGGITLPSLSNPADKTKILKGYEAIDANGNKITGTIDTVTQATPGIEISSSGLITASVTQSAGYVSAGSKSSTKQLATKSATTITPTANEQIAVSAGTYVIGDIKVVAMINAEEVAF